ncbi:MAG: HD domain-containing protein [Patescibacteria group bacterium]
MRREFDSPWPHKISLNLEKQNLIAKIPKEVSHVTETLEKAGFEAYLVGGCVRDLIMGLEPKDWDVTTNAKPDEIMALFPKTVYENAFGTVAVVNEDVNRETLKVIEVTPYRVEAKYSDFRHPDTVKFSNKIEDDLKRRDFTVNALAMDSKGHVLDLFGGLKDIEKKSLRTVGEADERFGEDALRVLRAVRLSLQLDFSIAQDSAEGIVKNAKLIEEISKERIREEIIKIILSNKPAVGITLLQKFGLLAHIIPELEEGIACVQGGEHLYPVWEHLLLALQHAADKDWMLEVRLAALFHDIGKPRTRRDGEKKQYTFYGHEVVGARMVKKIMERLKFGRNDTDLVEKLARNHMFFSDPEKITLSAVRRIIKNVGAENIWALMKVRECDRVGMKKKEAPYRLRKYYAMVEEALRDPISVSQLKINGNFLQSELKITPGPRMGWILHALLEEVLDDPTKNTEAHLAELAKSLNMLGDAELKTLGERGKGKKEELEEKEIEKLHEKHGVRK